MRLLLVALCGAFGALGQAPYDQPAALLLALVAGFVLWREGSAPAWTGWAFGTGYFALALVWIIEPFQVDVARHGWMAPFALLFLSTGLALFWGGAFWVARKLNAGPLGLALTWTMAELLRAYVFTGFPWASPAQVMIDGRASALLAWMGPHGATLCLMLLAASIAMPTRDALAPKVAKGVLLVAGLATLYLPDSRPTAATTGQWVRLVQPNAAQHLKWRPEFAQTFLQRQLDATRAPARLPEQRPDLIVWPETSIPWALETAGPVLTDIAQAAGGVPVALGALRFEGEALRNSVVVLDPQGAVTALYDKHHLVPFGEYMPLGAWAKALGLEALAATMGGFSAGPGPRLLDLGALGKAVPLVCYEAVFAHDVNAVPGRADFLLQLTNDAWFGDYAGPQQHLAQARMRAIEQGLPMMRAANTGISAMIDPYGRVLASLGLGQAGFIDAPLPAPLAPTLYSRWGDLPVILILVLAAAAAFWQLRDFTRVRN